MSWALLGDVLGKNSSTWYNWWWELECLNICSNNGVLIFWFCAEAINLDNLWSLHVWAQSPGRVGWSIVKHYKHKDVIVTKKVLWRREVQGLWVPAESHWAQEVGEYFLRKGWNTWINSSVHWIKWWSLGFLESYIGWTKPIFLHRQTWLGVSSKFTRQV